MSETLNVNGWVYTRFYDGGMVHENAAQTARKIHKVLNAEFPETEFRVRTEKYSMGSSVGVDWTDGPLSDVVAGKVKRFASTSFDGRDDSTDHHGYEQDGMRVYGAGYVQCQRTRSLAREAVIEAKLRARNADADRMLADNRWYWLNQVEAEIIKEEAQNETE